MNIIASTIFEYGRGFKITDFPNRKAHYGAIVPPLGVG